MKTNLVIGIDPGTDHTAFCIYNKDFKKPLIDFWTCDYNLDKSLYKQAYNSILIAIGACATKPDLVIIESFIGRGNTREIIGVLKLFLDKHDIAFTEVTPGSIKKNITGSGVATKACVIKSVNEKFGLQLKYKDRHSADSIACAYMCEKMDI